MVTPVPFLNITKQFKCYFYFKFQSQAQELETVRANNYGFSIGKPSKDAQLLEAADLQLKMGQLERYCEIMLELGEVNI